MLDIFGQPQDFSQMLKRVFAFTLIAGIICTLALSYFSPLIQSVLFRSSAKIDIGYVNLPWLIVIIPFGFALFARVFRLHDRISDLLGLRRHFDVRHILLPLAEGVGVNLDDVNRALFKENRHRMMINVFYKYAPNARDAEINHQLVSDALDNWGWFWCCVEPSVVLLSAAIVAGFLISLQIAAVFVIVAAFLSLVAFGIWFACIRAARHQVDDILHKESRRLAISEEFNAVLNPGA